MGALAGPIIGAVGSVAASAMSDKGEPSQSTSEPWSVVQPYLEQLYGGAQNLFQGTGGTIPYYPGSTVAGQSPYTQLGQQATVDRLGGAGIFGQGFEPASNLMQQLLSQFNPAMFGWSDMASGGYGPSTTNPGAAAFGSLMPTAQGQMLNSNPYLDQMFQGAAGQVTDQFQRGTMPALQSMFSAAGRYGPGSSMTSQQDLASQQYGRQLNNLASGIYGQNYANERSNQMQAGQLLGSMGVADTEAQLRGLQGLQQGGQYDTQNLLQMLPFLLQNANLDITQLMNLGQQQQGYNQQLIDADRQRWDFVNQQGSYLPLQQYSSILGSPMQQTSTGARAPGPSMLDQLFGGAQLGAGAQQWWQQQQPMNSNYGLNAFQGGGGTFAGMDSADYFSGF